MIHALPMQLAAAFSHGWITEAETVVPVPRVIDWATPLVLVLVWLLVAAAVLGPIFRYFGWDRPTSARFPRDA